MVEDPLAQHAPAIKVGGRRLSTSTKHSKPHPPPNSDSTDGTEKKAEATEDKPEGEVVKEGEEAEEEEQEAPKKHNYDDKKFAHRKAEHTRPTRDPQQNFKSFTGQRIGQPAGKSFGV